MSISKMDSRGHETFVCKPLAVTTKLHRPESAMDVQRRAILQMQEEEAARIKTQEDFERDFLDFSYLTGVDDYGLPLSTPYAVPDSVPDMYVPTQTTPAQEGKKDSVSKDNKDSVSKDNKDSVSKDGSEPESSGGTE